MNLFVIHVIFKPSFISYPADVVSVFSLELKRPVREAVHSILAIAETENILKCVMCVCCFKVKMYCINSSKFMYRQKALQYRAAPDFIGKLNSNMSASS